ncbi:unnamed protein product [Lampetra fluviatilis]
MKSVVRRLDGCAPGKEERCRGKGRGSASDDAARSLDARAAREHESVPLVDRGTLRLAQRLLAWLASQPNKLS